jgi:hypothetical protein
MIIFGTRGVTWSKESGDFACPGCGGTRQTYTRKTVRRFFTLYFIPLIPLDKLGEYVECQHCHNKYNEQVLSHDPAAEMAKARAEVVGHIKRVMVLTAVAGGDVGYLQAEAIRDFYKGFAGATLTQEEIDKEVDLARQAGVGPVEYAQRFAGQLNEHGKELVIKAAHAVAAAGGGLGEDGHELLQDLAGALGMSPAHFRGTLAELEE